MNFYRSVISACNKASRINPPKVEFAMINISYPVVCGDGMPVTVHTWWTGRSAKCALKEWLRLHPAIRPVDVDHAIVTEFKPVSRFEAIGDRVEVDDPTLHRMVG